MKLVTHSEVKLMKEEGMELVAQGFMPIKLFDMQRSCSQMFDIVAV